MLISCYFGFLHFSDFAWRATVVIPKSVKVIEKGAFYGGIDKEDDGTYKIILEAEPDFVFDKNVSDYFSYKDGKLEFHERPEDLMWKSVYC